jgi:hypothetical protein
MKITPFAPPYMDFYIEPQRSGVMFVTKSRLPLVTDGPEMIAQLVLPWAVIFTLGILIVFAIIMIFFREDIASIGLISRVAPAHLFITVSIVTVIAFIAGIVITVWKKRQQFTYGITEVVFGLFSIAAITYFLWDKPELSKFVGIGSALYVVSRGMGNVADAAMAELKAKRIQISATISNGEKVIVNVSEADVVRLNDASKPGAAS